MTDDFIKKLEEKRAALKAELEALTNATNEDGEARGLTEDEDADFDVKLGEMRKLDERIAELQDAERRETLAAKHHVETGNAGRVESVNEPNPVYRKGDGSTSFFRDLLSVTANRMEAPAARDRLMRSQETRAVDVNTTAGTGGEFAPPLWQVGDFVAYLRAGRITANLCNSNTLPSGVSSVNLPKVATGTATGIQASQGAALTDTALTTTSVSSSISTIGGKQIVPMQLLEQSGIPFDEVILQDLARDYSKQFDNQVLYGSAASGQLNGLVNIGTAQAYTSAAPVVASSTNADSFYYAVSQAKASMRKTIFMEPQALVMHPDRWAWIESAVDGQNRPLVVPDGNAYNPVGQDSGGAQGLVGRFAGLPVYVDALISQTANSATNQDEAYVLRTDQLWLYETALQSASFAATYADDAAVLFRVMAYSAFIPNRYAGAVVPIRGTGMVNP